MREKMAIDSVFNGLNRFSDYVHLNDERRRLRAEISAVGSRCGDCEKWMKSRQCPREKNVNGRNFGPSSGEPVCIGYSESAKAVGRRDRLTNRMGEVERAIASL